MTDLTWTRDGYTGAYAANDYAAEFAADVRPVDPRQSYAAYGYPGARWAYAVRTYGRPLDMGATRTLAEAKAAVGRTYYAVVTSIA